MTERPEVETTVNGTQPIRSLKRKALSIFKPYLRWPVDPDISLQQEKEIVIQNYRSAN